MMGSYNDGLFSQRSLDAMAFVSFIIGMMNYDENIDQSKLQETAENIMKDIHAHLAEQDRKIDEILEKLDKEG